MEYVYESKNVLSDEFCEHIITKFEKDTQKRKGCIYDDDIDEDTKKCTELQLSDENTWLNEIVEIRNLLRLTTHKYFHYLRTEVLKGVKTDILPEVFGGEVIETGYMIQKYGVGDYFDWHIDYTSCEKRQMYQNEQPVVTNRILAYIIYLNTLDQDMGGKTEFLNGKSICPSIGSILIFPTSWNYVHRGGMIKKGGKYIITGFLNKGMDKE